MYAFLGRWYQVFVSGRQRVGSFLHHTTFQVEAYTTSDGNIRYFEYENDDFVFLAEYKSGDPQRGVAFLPKRGVAVGFLKSFDLLLLNVDQGTRKRSHASIQDSQR